MIKTVTLLLVLLPLVALGRSTDLGIVSLIEIIAHPEEWRGKEVVVGGYLTVEFEGTALYLTKDHAVRRDGSNAVYVYFNDSSVLKMTPADNIAHPPKSEITVKYFDQRWVYLKGVFNNGHGHLGMFSGELVKVSVVAEQPVLPRLK